MMKCSLFLTGAVAAAAMLVAASLPIGIGLGATPALAASQPAPPKVASEDLIKRVVASQTGQSVDPISSHDPNRAAYDRIGKAIAAFARKHPSDDESSADEMMSLVREKVGYQDTAELRTAYASGLADALERALADTRISGVLINLKPDRFAHHRGSDRTSRPRPNRHDGPPAAGAKKPRHKKPAY